MEKFLHVLLIAISIFIVDIAVEIYAPALPNIANFFGENSYVAKLTISCNIAGLAISGLFYGGLSDYYGRRPIIMWGTATFCVASILCIFSTSIYQLIFFRFIQGIGQGAAVIVGFASIRDVYSGNKCAQMISRLSMLVAVSPAIAPILGSFILAYSSWKFIFILLGVSGFLVVCMLFFFFNETLKQKPTKKVQKFSIVKVTFAYFNLLKNKHYVAYSSIAILSFVWVWNVIASVPFLFLEDMGVSMKFYAFLTFLNVSGYLFGTILNQIYVIKFGIKKMMSVGVLLPIITDVLILFLYNTINLTPLIIECIWFFSALGIAFVIGNATNGALDQVENYQSSKAMAILVLMEMSISAFSIYLNGLFYNGTIVPICIFTIFCASLSAAVFYFQIFYMQSPDIASKPKQTP